MKKPPRFYRRGPTYYHVSRDGTVWTKLSRDYDEAIGLWREVERGSRHTFAALIDRYLDKMPDLGLAPKTMRDYRMNAEVLRDVFGHMPPNDIRPSDIARYLDEHPHATAANRQIALCSIIMGYGLRYDLIDRNVCLGVKRRKLKRRNRYITTAEFDAIKGAAGRLAPVVDLAYLTAIRKGDMLRLTWDDVTPEGLVVRVAKTDGNLLVRYSDRLASTLKCLQNASRGRTIVQTAKGLGYSATGFDSVWQRIRAKSGVVDIHWHDIRGTALTDLERTHGIGEAKKLAAHANQSMTEAYVRSRTTVAVLPVG